MNQTFVKNNRGKKNDVKEKFGELNFWKNYLTLSNSWHDHPPALSPTGTPPASQSWLTQAVAPIPVALGVVTGAVAVSVLDPGRGTSLLTAGHRPSQVDLENTPPINANRLQRLGRIGSCEAQIGCAVRLDSNRIKTLREILNRGVLTFLFCRLKLLVVRTNSNEKISLALVIRDRDCCFVLTTAEIQILNFF